MNSVILAVLLLTAAGCHAQCGGCEWHRMTDEDSSVVYQYQVESGNFIHGVAVEALLANTSQSVSIYALNEMQYLYFMVYGINYQSSAKIPVGKYEGNSIHYYISNVSRVVGTDPKWDYLKYDVIDHPDVISIRDNLYLIFYCNGYQSSNPDKGHCDVGVDVKISQLPYTQLPDAIPQKGGIFDNPHQLLIISGIALALLLVVIILLSYLIAVKKRRPFSNNGYTALDTDYH